MKPSYLDTAIKKLESNNRQQPNELKINIDKDFMGLGHSLKKVKDIILNAVADGIVSLKKSNFDVTVKNFPKMPEMKDLSGIKTSLDALQQTIGDIADIRIPEIQKVVVQNPIKLPKTIQTEIVNTSDITNAIDSLTSQLIRKHKDSKEKFDLSELTTKIDELREAIMETAPSNVVTVDNFGNFPVTFPIPTFRDSTGAVTQVRLDTSGYMPVVIKKVDSLLDKYQPADSDEVTTTKYYGFLDIDGNWYIFRDTGDTYRYVKGDSDYSTNWTNRASLTYDYYNNIFST